MLPKELRIRVSDAAPPNTAYVLPPREANEPIEDYMRRCAVLDLAPGQTFRVRIENLRLPANVAAGMNALRLCALAYRLRATTDEPEGPIEVTREADGTWRIHDGRHRYIAAVIAGRPDVLCVERP